MNYVKIYNQLCKRGTKRKKNCGMYLEKHHIIPLFFYKDNKRNLRYSDGILTGDGEHVGNISYLTAREHFIAHMLLCKIFSNTKWYYRCLASLGFFFNSVDSSHVRTRHFSAAATKKYEKIKIKISEAHRKNKKGMMIAKYADTGKKYGWVSVTDPLVQQGVLVHHSKGRKMSSQERQRRLDNNPMGGKNNRNYAHGLTYEVVSETCREIWQEKEKYKHIFYIDSNTKTYHKKNFFAELETQIKNKIPSLKNRKSIQIAIFNRIKDYHVTHEDFIKNVCDKDINFIKYFRKWPEYNGGKNA